MNKKKSIRRILFIAMWAVIIGGMTTLLVAASRRQREESCSEVFIGIKGSGEKYYIEKNDVLKMLESAAGGSLQGRLLNSIDLAHLERSLETDSWIRDAELYFDSKGALHVSVEEREPVARIFTTNGKSFYIDSSGHRMKLVDKLSARVPVITGFPDAKRMNAGDSSFLEEVKEVAVFVYNNPFWNAQVGQIDIRPDRSFEIIPVIGDHVIRLGDGHNIEEKLKRLYVFYRQVLSKVGFQKYAALDVRFDGQVVGVRKEPASPVDSLQLQKNIEELMKRAGLQEVDENMLPGKITHTTARNDSAVSAAAAVSNQVFVKTDPHPPVKNNTQSNPSRTTSNPSKEEPRQNVTQQRQPKAVMKRQ